MSLEELRKTVLEKARLEADEIIRDAMEKAKNIIREAEERKKAIVEEERKKALSELGLEARLAEARREARLIIARVKHEIVEEVRGRVKELLEGMSLEKRRESLKRLLYEALEELRSSGFEVDNIIVYVSSRDRELVKDLLREIGINGEVVEDRDIIGGLRVSTRGGEMSVDNTYNSRLEKALRTILPEVFKGVGVE